MSPDIPGGNVPPGAGPPVLAGGCPRSGTTLLRTMLDSHPHLAVPHETQFVVQAWRRRSMFGDLTQPDNRRDVARWIIDLPKSRYDRIGIPRDELVEAFAAARPYLGSLMATCFSLYAAREGKVRWGDKRPSYARNLTAVFSLFPNAQFINIVRDPRACAASMRKAWRNWGRLASAVETWERTDKAVQTALRKLPTDRILQIHYEDLVTEPQGTLERVCTFLGLDPAGIPDMLAYHTGENLPTGALHAATGRPVTTEGITRWETELAEHEVAFIEHVLAARLRRHGYELSGTTGHVPPVELAELQKVRSRRNREDRRVRFTELKRKVTDRYPTAAVQSP